MNNSPPPIICRRVKIDYSAADAANWSRYGSDLELALNAVSFLLPAGETYFANSVRYFIDRITDPLLKDQATRFIFQETMHSTEHKRSNAVIKEVHAFGGEIEKFADMLLSFSRRFMPRITQLATSCALEHFTAMFADCVLREQEKFRSLNDPAFAALWLWHAVEETEHKAVCFDVYQYVCGKGVFSYLHRIMVMAGVSAIAVTAIGIGLARVKWSRRKSRKSDPNVRKGQIDSLSGAKLSSVFRDSTSLQMYLDYYRPSFHPWNHDNANLIDEWKRFYGGFGELKTAAEQHLPAA